MRRQAVTLRILTRDRSELLPKVAQKYREHVLLAGNWEVTVGDLDTFCTWPPHFPLVLTRTDQIWRYDSYAAYDKVWEKSREDPVRATELQLSLSVV